MDQMERIIIHTEGLTKCYGEKTAVSELNLDIRKGEIFGLLGPNGAGKNDDDPDAPWPYGAYFRDGFYQWPGLYERSHRNQDHGGLSAGSDGILRRYDRAGEPAVYGTAQRP